MLFFRVRGRVVYGVTLDYFVYYCVNNSMNIICNFCQRTFSNKGGLGAHSPFCKSNPDRVQRSKSPNACPKKGSIPWNKGKTGVQTPWNKGKNGYKGFPHTEETKQLLSEIAKQRNFGGYVKGSGRGKKGWYKGFFCDSSWELAYVIYCLENSISIIRNTEKRNYIWEGKEYNYIPDFIVEGRIIEIKGWNTPQWEAKMQYNPDIIVLYKEEMTPILEYVIDKYGKDYISLYEGD